MFRSIKQLYGYKLGALDGEIGHAKGFYFDDKAWVIRYLVADTGSWMPGRTVLISPYALGPIYPNGKLLQVKLTCAKVENSPSIETQLPVARQHERDFYRYYNWPVYWGGPGLWGMNPIPLVTPSYNTPFTKEEPVARALEEQDSHLRSTQEVIGYELQASDGEVGHVEDFLINEENWAIDSLIIATGTWGAGKEVSVPSKSVERVNWEESKVFINVSRAALCAEPVYEPPVPSPRNYDPRTFR